MDTQPSPIHSLPPVQSGQLPPKRNMTRWVVISLFLGATVLTGLAYLIIPNSKSGPDVTQQTTTSTTPTPVPNSVTSENAKWKKYENVKYKYSFYYPDNWSLTKSQSEEFELLNSGDQRVIEGKILSKQEADALQICKGPESENIVCKTFPVTTAINAPVQSTMKNNVPDETTVLIPRPNDVSIFLKAPKSTYDSYQSLHVILYTLRFPGENRGFPLQICPESTSSDKKTVTYKSAVFPIEDVDQEFIKTCK